MNNNMCELEQEESGLHWQLPDDVSLVILSFLGVSDLSHVRLAQKSWSIFELTEHNHLWEPVFQSVIDRPRYESIKSSILERGQSVSNYRDKVLLLKQVLSDIVEKRKKDIGTVPSILDRPHHKYLGFNGLDEFSVDTIQVKKKKLDNIKVVVVGDGAVGKTYLQIRAAQNYYPEYYYPSVMDNYCVEMMWGGLKRSIIFWDTAASDDYARLRPLSYPYTDIFLMCFSVVNRSSFQNITKKWLPEVMHHWPEAIVMLVGTKIDLRDRPSHPLANVLDMVTHEEGECMAKHHNCMLYIETSALSGQNLHVEFHDTLARCALIGYYMRRNASTGNNHGKCILC